VDCAACGSFNESGRKFCGECGGALAREEEFFLAVGDRVASRTAPPPHLDDAAIAERRARAEELAPRYRTELLKP
jgi:hypothetical protein